MRMAAGPSEWLVVDDAAAFCVGSVCARLGPRRMRLDANKLRAESEAHRARLQGPLWSDDGGKRDDGWMAVLTGANPRGSTAQRRSNPTSVDQSCCATGCRDFLLDADDAPSVQHRPSRRDSSPTTHDILPRLDTLDRAVEKLTAALSHVPLEVGTLRAGWQRQQATRTPTTHLTPTEKASVRVLPTTYAQLQQLQHRMGLRTTAGGLGAAAKAGLRRRRGGRCSRTTPIAAPLLSIWIKELRVRAARMTLAVNGWD